MMNEVGMKSDIGFIVELLTRHNQGRVTIRLLLIVVWCDDLMLIARPMIREGELEL